MATTVDENIEALSRTIISEARAEADQIQAEARSKADATRQQAQQHAEADRKAVLDRANQEAERLRGQAVATAELKARTLQLERREILLDKVLNTVRQQLPEVQQQPDYEQIVCNLLREAITQLNATKATVRADQKTLKILSDTVLGEISQELKAEITLGDPLETGTGVIVDTADGHLHYDNTLETRLNRLYSGLRSTVYRILMGDTK